MGRAGKDGKYSEPKPDETGSMIFVISDSEIILVVLFSCGFDSLVIFTLDFNLWKCTNQSHERSLWKEVIPVSAINCFFVVILCIICHFLSFYFSFHTYTHCLFKHVKLLINYFQTFQFWLLRSIVFYKHFTILLLYFLSRNFSFWQTVWAKVLVSPYRRIDLTYTFVYPVPTWF